MNTECNNCLWATQCEMNDKGACSDYTPMDDSQDIEFYSTVLKENAEEYRQVESEFEDGRLPQ